MPICYQLTEHERKWLQAINDRQLDWRSLLPLTRIEPLRDSLHPRELTPQNAGAVQPAALAAETESDRIWQIVQEIARGAG